MTTEPEPVRVIAGNAHIATLRLTKMLSEGRGEYSYEEAERVAGMPVAGLTKGSNYLRQAIRRCVKLHQIAYERDGKNKRILRLEAEGIQASMARDRRSVGRKARRAVARAVCVGGDASSETMKAINAEVAALGALAAFSDGRMVNKLIEADVKTVDTDMKKLLEAIK